jgi:MFS transporter, DHA3 family, macrolide efflux protein
VNSTRKNLRTFYAIVATQTLSMLGSRLSGLAVGFEVYRDTGEATPLLLVSLFTMLPNIFAASIGGILADRWDRRKLMLVSDAGQAFCSLLLLVSFASGAFQLWHLYAMVVLSQVLSAMQGPAFAASITMLVPEEQRDRANAITQLARPSAGIIAPILSGIIYSAVGVVGTIAIDLTTFLVAAAVFLVLDIPMPAKSEAHSASHESLLRSLAGGFRFLWSFKSMLVLIIQFALVNFCIGGSMGMAMAYTVSRTGSEAEAGLILGISSAGALTGGLIMSVWGGTRPRIHTIMIGLIASGVALTLFGTAQTTPTLSATIFMVMLPLAFVNAPVLSILQAKTPPDMQGRVFAVIDQISLALMPPAYLLYGYLADNVLEPAVGTPAWSALAPLVGNSRGAGMAVIYVAAGIVMAVSSALVYALPLLRRMEATLPDYTPEPAAQPSHDPLPDTAAAFGD